MKRRNNLNTIKVETEKGLYAVTLERLPNGYAGQPRYEAAIVCLWVKEWGLNLAESINAQEIFHTPCYRFQGHYYGYEGEADWIVRQFEKEVFRDEH